MKSECVEHTNKFHLGGGGGGIFPPESYPHWKLTYPHPLESTLFQVVPSPSQSIISEYNFCMILCVDIIYVHTQEPQGVSVCLW